MSRTDQTPAGAGGKAPSAVQKILIVRLGSMGDVIHALPAVAALRQAFPKATLGWVIEERWAELLCAVSASRSGAISAQRPLVDRVHAVDTFRWRRSLFSPKSWREARAAIRELRDCAYDVAVDFQGAIRSAFIARLSRARFVYGMAQPREKPAAMFYTNKIAVCGEHVVEQGLSLAEVVSQKPLQSGCTALPHDSATKEKIESWLRSQGIARFAILNPGAGWGAKQWPPERYAEVARELAKDGMSSVVNFGPGEEALAREVETTSAGAAKALSCSVGELIALTRRASLFVSGDTGPMHLASALQIAVVALFGPTNPARNGPYGGRSVVLRSKLSSTSYSHHDRLDVGLAEIQSQEVVAAARKLLGSSGG
jgi:lipopolysaccharide heptosyltransferase I